MKRCRKAGTTVKRIVYFSAVAIALAAIPGAIAAWEPATTHPGLTEQAALASGLHDRLREDLGLERGLFAPLTIPPQDADSLFRVLRTLNPTHGYVPDKRGRLLALGWLAAGSVVADLPPRHAGNHFFDPDSKQGLSDATIRGLGSRIRHQIYTRLAGDDITRSGLPAPDWVHHAENPMNEDRFLAQYRKAIGSQTPAERQRHIAGTLLAAGAMVHVLQDMGSPSHVRNDLAAHIDVVGNDARDVGSRFERVAALAYGRLGIPQPGNAVKRPTLRAFFTAQDRGGLADRTAVSWFSPYTLPEPIRIRPGTGASAIGPTLERSLQRPHPAPLPRLDLAAARESQGARLVDAGGVCVAGYQLRQNTLSWYLDEECMAQQVAIILPEVAAYSRGLLEFLFRGAIAIDRDSGELLLSTKGADLGAGTVRVYWDDGRGVRTQYGKDVAIKGAPGGTVFVKLPKKLPAGARAIAAMFDGLDVNGQKLIAAGHLSLAASGDKKAN